jgi:hypothetical protein
MRTHRIIHIVDNKNSQIKIKFQFDKILIYLQSNFEKCYLLM